MLLLWSLKLFIIIDKRMTDVFSSFLCIFWTAHIISVYLMFLILVYLKQRWLYCDMYYTSESK